ncbi:MAG: hypothetical protein NZO16_00230 [Deltaproteobacteria bacterium]|nr:hypothetical protein [Deltaproteobacteria bacterium]
MRASVVAFTLVYFFALQVLIGAPTGGMESFGDPAGNRSQSSPASQSGGRRTNNTQRFVENIRREAQRIDEFLDRNPWAREALADLVHNRGRGLTNIAIRYGVNLGSEELARRGIDQRAIDALGRLALGQELTPEYLVGMGLSFITNDNHRQIAETIWQIGRDGSLSKDEAINLIQQRIGRNLTDAERRQLSQLLDVVRTGGLDPQSLNALTVGSNMDPFAVSGQHSEQDVHALSGERQKLATAQNIIDENPEQFVGNQTAANLGLDGDALYAARVAHNSGFTIAQAADSLHDCAQRMMKVNPELSLAEAVNICDRIRMAQNSAGGSAANPSTTPTVQPAEVESAPSPNIRGVYFSLFETPVIDPKGLEVVRKLFVTELNGQDYKLEVKNVSVSPVDEDALFLSEYGVVQRFVRSPNPMAAFFSFLKRSEVARFRMLLGDSVLLRKGNQITSATYPPAALEKFKCNYCDFNTRHFTYWKFIYSLLSQLSYTLCNELNNDQLLDPLLWTIGADVVDPQSNNNSTNQSQTSAQLVDLTDITARKLAVTGSLPNDYPKVCYQDLDKFLTKTDKVGNDFIEFLNAGLRQKLVSREVISSVFRLVLGSVGFVDAADGGTNLRRYKYNCDLISADMSTVETIFDTLSNLPISTTKLKELDKFKFALANDLARANIQLASRSLLSKHIEVALNDKKFKLSPYSVILLTFSSQLAETKIQSEIYHFANAIFSEMAKSSTAYDKPFFGSNIKVYDWMLTQLSELSRKAANVRGNYLYYTRAGQMGGNLENEALSNLRRVIEILETASHAVGAARL